MLFLGVNNSCVLNKDILMDVKCSIPNMEVDVGSLRLANPVLAASGTFGYGQEYDSYLNLKSIGGIVTKAISLEPKNGNMPPRIYETSCGLLNAIGLANVGVKVFLKEKQPYLAKLTKRGVVVIVNLYAENLVDFIELTKHLVGVEGISGLEINLSCPNVKKGGMVFGVDSKAVAKLTRAVTKVADSLPVWVKLTPNIVDPVPFARAALESGANAVSLINTLLGMAIDARFRRPRLANVYGGLSGPAIKPIGLRMVHQVAQALPDINIIGVGGIMKGEDVVEYMLAGASAVQVGTANFTDPRVCQRIVVELMDYCRHENLAEVKSLVGGLKV